MHVDIHHNFLLLIKRADQISHIVDFRLIIFFASFPLAVEVATVGREAIVALDDPVRIEHWNNFE
jgi:hypothetical protein